MADLLARLAFLLLLPSQLLLLLGLSISELVLHDVLGLMLGELASGLILTSLATAPPHFAAPL